MQGILKRLPVLGLAVGLAALAPRTGAAQETTSRDSLTQAVPGDTAQTPPGYQGMERSTDSALTDTTALGDSLSGDTSATGTPRISPTDSAGDSTSILPSDSAGIRPASPTDHVNPNPDSPTEGP